MRGSVWLKNSEPQMPLPESRAIFGMLLQAAEALKIDLAKSFMIGDRWRDIDCGFNAGCQTIFVNWDYEENLKRVPDFNAHDLLDAAKLIEQLEHTDYART
jgi:histidinol phosphatase-like enzyme